MRLAGFHTTGSQINDTSHDNHLGSNSRGGGETGKNSSKNNAGRECITELDQCRMAPLMI